ncbi:hypothetical protein EMCRGX_G030519 [Ephydatia muelleri]
MRSRLIPIRMQEWNQDCVPLPIATSYYMSTIGQWYPLQEAEGKSLDYSDHTSAYPSRPSGSEDDNIDELWTKFLSTYCPAKKTGAVPAGRCEPDVYLCEPDSEKLVFAADLKCTCDCSSGTSHGHFRSRGAPDSSGAITMSLQEACKGRSRTGLRYPEMILTPTGFWKINVPAWGLVCTGTGRV